MNRNTVIVIIVILTLIGGGWYYKTNSSGPRGGMMNKESASTEGNIVSGTLQDLFARNTPMMCTFSYNADTSTSGTVYISGKKMRGAFSSNVEGKPYESAMIRDDMTMYTWMTDQKQGMKMKIDESATKTTYPTGSQSTEPFEMDKAPVDYDCQPWTVDESMFTPPADVTFTDLSAQMEKIQESVGSMKATQCATCEQLPAGDGKTQCLQALGC